MNVFVVIILFFLVGVGLRYFFSPPQRLTDYLNRFVIHFAFPAVILTVVPFLSLTPDVLIPALSFWCLVPVTWLLSKKLSLWFKWSRDIQCVCFILLTFGNTGFLGVPMAKAFLENESIAYALLYDQLGTFLGLVTVAAITLARFEDHDAKTDVKKLALKVIFFTPFPVLVVSLLLPIKPLVTPLLSLLEVVAQLIVPATMTVVGLQFTLKVEKKYYSPLVIILLIKMLLMPAAVWFLLSGFSLEPAMLASIVFQVAAPPMITAAALLISARIAVPLVGSTLGLGTILSFLVWPLWAVFL